MPFDYHEFIKVEESYDSLQRKFHWLIDSGLTIYKTELLRLFQLTRLPTRNLRSLVEQIIPRTLQELGKKQLTKQYYLNNAICFINTLEWILDPRFIDSFDKHRERELPWWARLLISRPPRDLFVYNYHHLFQSLLFEGVYIFTLYEARVLKVEPKFAAFKPEEHHHAEMFLFVRQLFFGQSSYHSFIETEPDLAVATLRQCIELRLRRAVGVLGLYNPNQDTFEPLPMRVVFDAISEVRDQIDFSVPIANIDRIYAWTNIYIHAGLKDHGWKTVLAHRYLHTFCVGKQRDGGSSVDWGIETNQETLTKLKTIILDRTSPKRKWSICRKSSPIHQLVETKPAVFLRANGA